MSKAANHGKHKLDDFPLLSYLDGLVDDLRKHVSGALKEFDSGSIHDARVSTRRLKAALDLLEPKLTAGSRKPFARVLKKLRRRLGPLRDGDVMLEHLHEIAKTERHRERAGWMIACLEKERMQARKVAGDKAGPAAVLAQVGTWWGLREEIADAAGDADTLLAKSLHLQLDSFAEQADLIVVRERPAPRYQEPGAPQDPPPPSRPHAANPHEVRIVGKALRYTLEMAREQGHQLPVAVAKSFKKMQDCLGIWHDYVVLTEKMMELSVREMLAHHDLSAQQGVLELARLTLQRADQELKKFASLWKGRGHELARTIRTAFPLTRSLQVQASVSAIPPASLATPADTSDPTQPKMDRDPPGSEQTSDPQAASRGAPSTV